MELSSGHIFIHVPICLVADLFIDLGFCNKRMHCVEITPQDHVTILVHMFSLVVMELFPVCVQVVPDV